MVDTILGWDTSIALKVSFKLSAFLGSRGVLRERRGSSTHIIGSLHHYDVIHVNETPNRFYLSLVLGNLGLRTNENEELLNSSRALLSVNIERYKPIRDSL